MGGGTCGHSARGGVRTGAARERVCESGHGGRVGAGACESVGVFWLCACGVFAPAQVGLPPCHYDTVTIINPARQPSTPRHSMCGVTRSPVDIVCVPRVRLVRGSMKNPPGSVPGGDNPCAGLTERTLKSGENIVIHFKECVLVVVLAPIVTVLKLYHLMWLGVTTFYG